jgi:hypothetical protein
LNAGAEQFYRRLGFRELARAGPAHDRVIYMGLEL